MVMKRRSNSALGYRRRHGSPSRSRSRGGSPPLSKRTRASQGHDVAVKAADKRLTREMAALHRESVVSRLGPKGAAVLDKKGAAADDARTSRGARSSHQTSTQQEPAAAAGSRKPAGGGRMLQLAFSGLGGPPTAGGRSERSHRSKR
eukprot:gene13446-13572_t